MGWCKMYCRLKKQFQCQAIQYNSLNFKELQEFIDTKSSNYCVYQCGYDVMLNAIENNRHIGHVWPRYWLVIVADNIVEVISDKEFKENWEEVK